VVPVERDNSFVKSRQVAFTFFIIFAFYSVKSKMPPKAGSQIIRHLQFSLRKKEMVVKND